MRVALADGLRARLLAAAAAAYPGEYCGLLEGERGADMFRIHALHPARNLSGDVTRFAIDPHDQFAAQKTARAQGRAIVGCYHSHPRGRAQPSAADLAGAGEENFLWLIAADAALAAFVYSGGRFVECTGADWVTSSPPSRTWK